MKKCAIYVRVSPGQRVHSQLYDLRLHAQQLGFEIACEYTDVGSGSKARRPGLDAMLKDARNGRFNVVIVAAFDRVERSTKHFLSVMVELDRLGIEFVSKRENIATYTAAGRQFLAVISSLANMESDIIKEHIRAGMHRRRQDGLQVGRRPLEVDRQSLVRDRLSGMSLSEVARRYSVSRPSVVRWVRQARQTTSTPNVCVSTSPDLVEECAA